MTDSSDLPSLKTLRIDKGCGYCMGRVILEGDWMIEYWIQDIPKLNDISVNSYTFLYTYELKSKSE